MFNVLQPGLQFYVDKLNAGQRFSFARYGNGEWECILSLYHRTRSGSQTFTPDLRAALTATLTTRPATGDHYVALQSVAYLERQTLLPRIRPWLAEHAPGLAWHDGELLPRASRHGRLFPFVAALRDHRVVVVGPPHLRSLPLAQTFIPVTPRDCWQDAARLTDTLSAYTNAVILFSAGPTAKVLIHRLQPLLPSSWLIDCGSLWDVYCGVNSRSYHRRIDAATLRRNLEGQ